MRLDEEPVEGEERQERCQDRGAAAKPKRGHQDDEQIEHRDVGDAVRAGDEANESRHPDDARHGGCYADPRLLLQIAHIGWLNLVMGWFEATIRDKHAGRLLPSRTLHHEETGFRSASQGLRVGGAAIRNQRGSTYLVSSVEKYPPVSLFRPRHRRRARSSQQR